MAITRMKTILTTSTVRRQLLHTITSRTTIKPSSPTPPHLRTYNLSPIDIFASKTYLPLIFFYPNTNNSVSTDPTNLTDLTNLTFDHKATVLKNSLSQTLSQYYPFAGRMSTPTTPHIDCTDDGVTFLESHIDTRLDTFLNLTQQDESFYRLFANDMSSYTSSINSTLVGVQLNRFRCGGIGLAVSISHIVADGSSLGSFLCHWAAVARHGSIDHPQVKSFNPVFLNSKSNETSIDPKHQARPLDHTNIVSRRFLFPNSKLTELKNTIVSESDGSVPNPSRVEALTSLLYKTAVSDQDSTSSHGSYLFMMVNNRDKFVPKLPQTTVGNFVSVMLVPMRQSEERWLSTAVAEMKRRKSEIEGIQSVEQVVGELNLIRSRLRNGEMGNAGSYWCSSMCGFPSGKLDFGWGKPVGTIPAIRSLHKNGFLLIDAGDGDGIEAWVLLEKERMEVFEKDQELLSFCKFV